MIQKIKLDFTHSVNSWYNNKKEKENEIDVPVVTELATSWFQHTSNILVCPYLLFFLYPPQTLFVVGILFSRCPSVRVSVRNLLFP